MYIFVTGTDTDVGKTYISKGIGEELIKNGETVGYLKPFQSGYSFGILSDAQQVGRCKSIMTKASYETQTPSCPLISAEIDGIEYDTNKVYEDYRQLKAACDNVIVEGSGGIYAPVKRGVLIQDVIKELNLPALVVARPDLGTINHTLMTIECLQNANIKVLGVVISNYPLETEDPVILRAKEMIELYSGDVKVLSVIKRNQTDFSTLTSKILESFTLSI